MPEFSKSPNKNNRQSVTVDKVSELREIIEILTGVGMTETDENLLAKRAVFFFEQKRRSAAGLKLVNENLRRRLDGEGCEQGALSVANQEETLEFAKLMCASKGNTSRSVLQEDPIKDLAKALRAACGEHHPLSHWKTERELFDNLRLTASLLALEAESLVRESKYISKLLEEGSA